MLSGLISNGCQWRVAQPTQVMPSFFDKLFMLQCPFFVAFTLFAHVQFANLLTVHTENA